MDSSSSTFPISLYGLFPNSINLELLILQTVGRTPWTGVQLVSRPLSTQDNTNTEETETDIHVSSGIRTHDPSAID
jgi:hypothetical protein